MWSVYQCVWSVCLCSNWQSRVLITWNMLSRSLYWTMFKTYNLHVLVKMRYWQHTAICVVVSLSVCLCLSVTQYISSTARLNSTPFIITPAETSAVVAVPMPVISDISVLKFISVLVSISFSVNHFYVYIISVLTWTII